MQWPGILRPLSFCVLRACARNHVPACWSVRPRSRYHRCDSAGAGRDGDGLVRALLDVRRHRGRTVPAGTRAAAGRRLESAAAAGLPAGPDLPASSARGALRRSVSPVRQRSYRRRASGADDAGRGRDQRPRRLGRHHDRALSRLFRQPGAWADRRLSDAGERGRACRQRGGPAHLQSRPRHRAAAVLAAGHLGARRRFPRARRDGDRPRHRTGDRRAHPCGDHRARQAAATRAIRRLIDCEEIPVPVAQFAPANPPAGRMVSSSFPRLSNVGGRRIVSLCSGALSVVAWTTRGDDHARQKESGADRAHFGNRHGHACVTELRPAARRRAYQCCKRVRHP